MVNFDLTAGFPLWLRPLASGLGAFLIAAALTPVVISFAGRMGWVDEPQEDRWHERPTAQMGGMAIFAATAAGWILAPNAGELWPLVTGGVLMFGSGMADDLQGLSPVAKVLAQVAGATVLLLAGWELAPGWPVWLSAPLTYLWVIGITNAVNLLDNMDGLAAGIAAIASLTVAVLAGLAGRWAGAASPLAVAGGAVGFLLYNRPPARIFMGDGGALFLGFVVAGLALSQPGAGASGTAAVLAVPAAVMAVPILDTTLVTVRRIVSGRPVTQGGRDHSSHRLVFLGLSERRAVWTLYAVAAAFSVLAVTLQVLNVILTLAVAALSAVALAVFGVFLGEVRVETGVYSTRSTKPGDQRGSDAPPSGSCGSGGSRRQDGAQRVALRSVMRHKREIGGLLADLFLIVGSFVVAHYLRFETSLPQEHLDRMVGLIPIVVLVKIATLWGFGAYRGLLRYAGSNELLKVAKASTIGSGLLVVGLVLAFRFEGYSRSVFVIDWMLATLSLGAIRGAFRGLRSYFASRRSGTGARVLLYGAGDAGFLALREIRQNESLDYDPIGFLDDDVQKQERSLHGLPVLGGREDLDTLFRDFEVDLVLLTISELPDRQLDDIHEVCVEHDVRLRRMRFVFRPVKEREDGGEGLSPSEARDSDDL